MIGMKTCNNCKTEKPFSDFYKCSKRKDGLQTECKLCQNKRKAKFYSDNIDKERKKHLEYYRNNKKEISVHRKEYYSDNKDKISKSHKEYYENNRKTIREKAKNKRRENIEESRRKEREYQRNNKDKVAKWHKNYRESHKEQLREYDKKYRELNKDKINKSRLERLHNDQNFKLKEQTRNMLRYVLRSKGHRKESRTKDIVGCDLDFLCEYLFDTWEKRYGKKWNGEPFHIDHIVPISTAKTEEDIIELCHYTNLQLLTPEDNMEKSDKLDW